MKPSSSTPPAVSPFSEIASAEKARPVPVVQEEEPEEMNPLPDMDSELKSRLEDLKKYFVGVSEPLKVILEQEGGPAVCLSLRTASLTVSGLPKNAVNVPPLHLRAERVYLLALLQGELDFSLGVMSGRVIVVYTEAKEDKAPLVSEHSPFQWLTRLQAAFKFPPCFSYFTKLAAPNLPAIDLDARSAKKKEEQTASSSAEPATQPETPAAPSPSPSPASNDPLVSLPPVLPDAPDVDTRAAPALSDEGQIGKEIEKAVEYVLSAWQGCKWSGVVRIVCTDAVTLPVVDLVITPSQVEVLLLLLLHHRISSSAHWMFRCAAGIRGI